MDVCHLVNLRTCHCNSIPIVAFYPDFFFLVGAVDNSDAGWGGDAPFLTLSHKVGETELVPAVADGVLDGEVGGYEAHFVAVAFGDSSDHVLDVAKEGATTSNELAIAGPGACENLLGLLVPFDVETEMTEITGKSPSGTCDCDNTGFDLDLNAVLLDIKVGRLENGARHFTV